MSRDRTRKDTGTNDSIVRISSDNQYEMTAADSPLYDASEELNSAKMRLSQAKDNLAKAEKAWIDEMKKIRKTIIKHKGEIIEYVKGRITIDHARFKKAK